MIIWFLCQEDYLVDTSDTNAPDRMSSKTVRQSTAQMHKKSYWRIMSSHARYPLPDPIVLHVICMLFQFNSPFAHVGRQPVIDVQLLSAEMFSQVVSWNEGELQAVHGLWSNRSVSAIRLGRLRIAHLLGNQWKINQIFHQFTDANLWYWSRSFQVDATRDTPTWLTDVCDFTFDRCLPLGNNEIPSRYDWFSRVGRYLCMKRSVFSAVWSGKICW